MKTKDMFEETKIKMVMKLKKLSHRAAAEEVARCGVQHAAQRIGREGEPMLMSAEDFFGED